LVKAELPSGNGAQWNCRPSAAPRYSFIAEQPEKQVGQQNEQACQQAADTNYVLCSHRSSTTTLRGREGYLFPCTTACLPGVTLSCGEASPVSIARYQ